MPDERNRSNPKMGAYLRSVDEIRTHPPVPAPPRARQPADGNASPTSRHHPTTATRRYGHTSTAPAEYASIRRLPHHRHSHRARQPADRHANPGSRTSVTAGTRRWAHICAAWMRYARIRRPARQSRLAQRLRLALIHWVQRKAHRCISRIAVFPCCCVSSAPVSAQPHVTRDIDHRRQDMI